MANSGDTAGFGAEEQGVAGDGQGEPSPASHQERSAHFYAYEAARESGEKLNWNDERRHRWPKKDRINWVACQLRGLEKEIAGCKDEEQQKSLERRRDDLVTWMQKEYESQSWSQIASNQMNRLGIRQFSADVVREAFESQARRAHGRVERSHPGSSLYKPEPIDLEAYCPNCGYPWL